MVRLLRPGGELHGTSVVRQAGMLHDAFVLLMQLRGVFGPGQILAELETSRTESGLVHVSTSRNGALAYFCRTPHNSRADGHDQHADTPSGPTPATPATHPATTSNAPSPTARQPLPC